MTTDYDPIAEQYQRSKQQPWRTFIEMFTLMQLVGDPQGLDVLDVACGEGYYTRLLRQRGAARVAGVDLSQRMIDLARNQESRHQLGITYVVGWEFSSGPKNTGVCGPIPLRELIKPDVVPTLLAMKRLSQLVDADMRIVNLL